MSNDFTPIRRATTSVVAIAEHSFESARPFWSLRGDEAYGHTWQNPFAVCSLQASQ